MINSSELLEEAIFLGLRMRKGINIKEFENDYGINIIEKHSKTIEKFTSIKLMDYSNNNLKLTDKGVLLSNNILAEFLD